MNTRTRRINKKALPPPKKVSVNLELTEQEKERLLPCPFCGSKNLELCNTHTASYWIECLLCSATVHGVAKNETRRGHTIAKQSAIACWNTRTTFTPHAATITTSGTEGSTAP